MGLHDLADELLRIILEQITAEPEKLISLERRAYLSQESFKAPPPPEPDQAQTIAAFRLTCRRFSNLGAIHQFSRVTTRFSRNGLERLEKIASQPHIASRVKKFSYMVPFFYVEGRDRVHELLSTQPEHLNVQHFQKKVNEQREIVRTREDLRVLTVAISAFTNLQHVQLLRVQDMEDGKLISYIREHHELDHLVQLTWPPACLHSTKTIGAALLESRSPCSRFSSPMLSPQIVLGAADHPPTTMSILAERLTCLELHFDDGHDLDIKIRQLSSLSKELFTAAKNIEALHIGFPSYRHVTLRLEEIFHNVKWDKLQAFGIQAWRLDADEIIAMAVRHRETLRGLRLRDVLLKEKGDSQWKDVLVALRENMMKLDWVSLRRIDYEKHYDESWILGAEIDDHFIGSDSSDESEDWEHPEDDILDHQDANFEDESDASTDDEGSDIEPEQGGAMHFPPIPISPDTPASMAWCNCNGNAHMDSVEVLGDDGTMVTNVQRKFWEKWVVRKVCSEHHTK